VSNTIHTGKDYKFLDISRLLPIIVYVVFGLSCFGVFLVYKTYLFSFFLAGIFYILFRKPYQFLTNKISWPKSVSASLMTLFVIVTVALPLILVIATLIQEFAIAIASLKKWATTENLNWLYGKFHWFLQNLNISLESLAPLKEKLLSSIQDITLPILNQGVFIVVGIFEIVVNFLLAMLILFFLFRSGKEIPNIIYQNLPFPDSLERKIGHRLGEVLDATVKGNLLVALLQGTFIGTYFLIFGLPTPIFYGTLASFFALIPVIGTTIVWLPGAVYLYFTGNGTSAIILGVLSLPTYLLLENFLKPWLLDKKLNMHPLFLFLAILGGLAQFGIQGLIIGPFLVTAFITLWQVISVWNKRYGKFNKKDMA